VYRTGLKDNVRAEAALESWYGKVPQDLPNAVRYTDALLARFGDRARARQVVDAWTKKNPRDSTGAALLRRTI